MNLAEYLRYSSDNQRSVSIEEQQREIHEWAKKEGHTIIASYSDSALSGKFDYRPNFEKMLSDAATAPWEGVVVFDLTRFSRAGEYGIVDNLRLSEHGKMLLSVTESFSDDFGGKLVKYIKMLTAEEYIENLRVNVLRGHKQNALNAMHNGGTPPLGYDIDPKTLEMKINEHEAEAVRLIFEMYADNKSYRQICNALNERGFKTKRNSNEFTKNSIYSILSNKKYIGIYEWGKKKTNIHGRKKQIVYALPEDVIDIIGGCPTIIDKSLFEKVQLMKNTKKRTVPNAKAKVDYLLRGKVHCGQCGSAFVGSSTRSHNKKIYVYVCSGKKNGHSCSNRNISKDVIETRVVEEIKNQCLSDVGVAWITDIINSMRSTPAEPAKQEDNVAILKIIDKLENKLKRLKEAYYSEIIELDELKKEKFKIDSEINRQKSKIVKINPFVPSQVNIKEIIEKYRQKLIADSEIINELVDDVIIDGEKITIKLKTLPFFEKDKDKVGGGGGNRTPFRNESANELLHA